MIFAGNRIAAQYAMPQIPPSDRVLSVQEVKNFWINTIKKMPIPNKPTGLHPEKRHQWHAKLEWRKGFISDVRNGVYDTNAKLVQLKHNADAWHRQGNEKKSQVAKVQLREMNEHLARLEVLELQRRAAQAQINAAEKIRALEEEISLLRSSCSHDCCPH